MARGRIPTIPVPQCLCFINLHVLIHFQNTKESQHFHKEFTGHSKKKLLFSLQKFAKTKARAARLTQGASSSTSGKQIQPTGQTYLTHLSFTVIVPSPVCLSCPYILSLLVCLCQEYRMEERRGQKGYGRSQNFGHCPREFSLNSFNPNKIEFGPPRLQYLKEKGKKIVLTGRHLFSLTDYKATMFYTTQTHPKYQKYEIFFPHRFSSYQSLHHTQTRNAEVPIPTAPLNLTKMSSSTCSS